MKVAATVAALAVAMVIPTRAGAVGRPASARLLFHPACHSLRCVERSQRRNLRHARYVCQHGAGVGRSWNCNAETWLLREHARTLHRLRPPLPLHYSGWMCIHRYEGAWGATNPNGHYNGLQMTWGWGELTGNPNSYTPMQILWAAEHEAMRHLDRAGKIESWWLIQQWGQTIGPCWQHFR